MPRTVLECQASKMVNRNTCSRPTTGTASSSSCRATPTQPGTKCVAPGPEILKKRLLTTLQQLCNIALCTTVAQRNVVSGRFFHPSQAARQRLLSVSRSPACSAVRGGGLRQSWPRPDAAAPRAGAGRRAAAVLLLPAEAADHADARVFAVDAPARAAVGQISRGARRREVNWPAR